METGTVIAERFEIVRRAGSGAMGTVYRARDLLDGGDVALKVLHAAGSRTEGRFVREAKVLATMSHPALARYVAHGATPAGDRYLAMEWFEGVELERRLRQGPLSPTDAITLGSRIAGALGVAHAAGVVHRDVKPSNILLQDGAVEQVKLIDFGIARLPHPERVTHTGQAIGTPRYMAPEQARGEKDIDARADVYSLGCVLFACLTGRPAFDGADARAILAKILIDDAPRVRELRPELPVALDELVAKMMAKRAELRPSNCDVVTQMLQSIDDVEDSTVEVRPPRAAGLGYREQRLTCLVLVAGPELSELPEAPAGRTIHEAVTAPHAARAVVREYGGHLERLADGSVIAVLPGVDSAKAQATRAARCALAMRKLIPRASMALATVRRDISARASLSDMIDRAAGVLVDDQSSEGADAPAVGPVIRVDPVSADLLAERFDIAERSHWLELRGEKEPVDVTRTLLGKPTPCVGRTRELGILKAVFQDCIDESAPRAVLITGAAGMGKSRIRYEFTRWLEAGEEPFELLVGRGDPMRAGAAFAMLARALRRLAGVHDGEDPGAQRGKVEARIGRRVTDERQRVIEFLGELVGVPFPDDDRVQLRAARHDAAIKGEQMRRAWEDWLDAETAANPVVLVLEDLHWGDWPTVKFVDSALRNLSERPFMVLALARPEVKKSLPNLWEGRGMMEIELTPLSRRASEKLVRSALGGDAPPSVIDGVVEQAAGNAFFLEELIRVSASGASGALPDSVLAIVQARLDELPAEARLILRAASIFGGRFWKHGLAQLVARELDDSDLDDWLRNLVEREVISVRRDRKFPDEDEYVFRHSLVREAAYAMLTEADRRTGHQLVAGWLEQAGEADAIVLAEHHERGDQPDRAAGFYLQACQHALEGGDNDAAVLRATHGLACLERSNSNDVVTTGRLRLLHARALAWKGQFRDAQSLCRAALSELSRGSVHWCDAAAMMATASGNLADNAAVTEMGNELLQLGDAGADDRAYVSAAALTASQLLFAGRYELARKLLAHIDRKIDDFIDDEPGVAAAIYRVLGVRSICNGDLAAGLKNKSASVTAYEQAGDHAMAQQQRGNLGSVYVNLGAYAERWSC